MTMSVYDPGRDRMKSNYDRLMSRRDDENGMTPAEATRHGAGGDRRFGPLGGLVIGAALSVPL